VGAVSRRLRSGEMSVIDDGEVRILSVRFSSDDGELKCFILFELC